MGVPKRKRSRARRDSRFANKGIKVKAITSCKNCNNPLLTHAACTQCGFYKGVKVMSTKSERALKRGQVQQAKAARQQSETNSAEPKK
ncbi:MAG: 50S ribosomal protein L32 [Candidatus Babeliales bacterium]